MAQQLRLAGVQANDRVMIINENCIALIVLIFATTRLNAWPLLVNARLTSAEIEQIRAHAKPCLTVYTTEASPSAQQHAKRDHAWNASCVAFDIGTLAFSKAAASPLGLNPSLTPHNPAPSAGSPTTDCSQQCAALLYTTGTTGTPKG